MLTFPYEEGLAMIANRVNHAIKDVSDRLKTGNMVWLECLKEDREAAQARLYRKKQRDRLYDKKGQKATA